MEPTQSHATSAEPAWVAPSGVVDRPAPRGVFAVASSEVVVDEVATRALEGSPVSRLGPRSFRQLLDGGFDVMRFRFTSAVALGAVLVMPLVAVPSIMGALWNSELDDNPFATAGADPFADMWGDVFGLVGWTWASASLAHTLLAVALSYLVTSWLVGRDPGIRDALGHTARRLPVVLAAFLLVSVTKLSILFCGLGVVLLPIWAMLGPVLGAEQLGVWASIKRAWTLGRRRYGRMVGISCGFGLASFLLGLGASLVPTYFGQILGLPEDALVVVAVVMEIAANVVLAIVLVGITTLTYLDVRVRTEGLDIELGAQQRLDRVAR